MRWTHCLGVVLLAFGTASAEPVAVKVVEVAGETAYVSPGRAAGLVRGTKITIRGQVLVVVEVTETTAAVKLEKRKLATGDTGTANVTKDAAVATAKLPAPRAPELFVGQWAPPVLPATTQDPQAITLGSGRAAGRSHLAVIVRGYGGADRDRREGDVEGRVIGSFDLTSDRPLAIDVDVAGRWFSGGYTKQTRTPVYVRAAQLRYGTADDPRFALGRLRYAASSVGMLDGGRASMRIGNLGLAAFGGMVPDPLSGKPDTGAARFGGEVEYDAVGSAWQPRLAVAAYGSTWDGSLDERRLTAAASASHGSTWLDGWAEAQSFPSDNPWGAAAVELTGAGASTRWRKRGAYAGFDVSFQRPDRSRRLAAALPLEWLCTPTSEIGDTGTTCDDDVWWTSSTASAGMRTARWAIDAIGTLGHTSGIYRGLDRSAYLRGELRFGSARVEAGASAGKASFASWNAAEIGAGFAPTRSLDLSARYRPELLDYVASTGPGLLHSLVADAHVAMSTELDLALSAIATTGFDRDALALLAVLAWRPLP